METFRSLSPFTHILKLFSLNCVFVRNDKLDSSWSVKKVTLLSILFIIIQSLLFFHNYYLFHVLEYTFEVLNLVELVQVTTGFFQYILDLCLVFKYGTELRIKYLELYEHIDKILGATDNMHQTIKTKILFYCSLFLIIFLVSTITDFVVWTGEAGVWVSGIYFCDYLYLFVKLVTILDFISQIILIEYRLKLIVRFLENRYERTVPKYHFVDNWVHSTVSDPGGTRLGNLNTLNHSLSDELCWLVNCYLLLIKQCNYVNKIYGPRMLMNCVSFMQDIVFFLTLSCNYLITIMTEPDGSFGLLSSALRFLNGPIVLTCFVYRCEQCYRETENIINLADELRPLIVKTDPKSTMAIIELRNSVLSRPVTFTAANFFRIDYALLVSIASACVTYTIILSKI